jgi:hypothetical protein
MKHFLHVLLWIGLWMGISHAGAAQSTYQVASSNGANLRQGPGKDQPVAMSVPNGAKVKVVERTNAQWVKVEYNGKTGYMASELLEPEKQNQPAQNQNNSGNNSANSQPAKSQSSQSSSPSSSSSNRPASSGNNQSSNSGSLAKKPASNNSASANYNWGIGFRLGDPTGVSVKKYNGSSAWEFNLGRSYRWGHAYDSREFYRRNRYDDRSRYHYYGYTSNFTTALQAHYLVHRPLGNAEGLSWYFGGGVQARFTPVTYYYYYNEYNLRGDDWWRSRFLVEERITDIDLGLDGVIGLEYKFRNAPLSIFVDANVFVEIIDAPFWFYGQSGLGLRYNF